MPKTSIFTKISRINAPVHTVFQWHEKNGALERLIPPWDPLDVVFKSQGIQKGARAVMKIPAGPLPIKLTWLAEHTRYTRNQQFQDKQLKGPFKYWVHTHTFTPQGNACIMQDQIEYALPAYLFGPLVGNAAIRNKLERIFHYRHTTLARDLESHLAPTDQQPLTFLISGASGVVGTALIPFLTTGGHRVIRLVRNQETRHPDEIFWDPSQGYLDLTGTDPVDVAIHLSGENIGEGRWTPQKKKKIIESRNDSTRLIATTLARMASPPRLLLCASAIGYYGDRGDHVMTEANECGADFISGVCSDWEAGASAAVDKGIRVAFLRIGVVITPLGGALKKFLLPFRIGLGGKIGSGRQYMSWISVDDLIYAIQHIIHEETISGPVNLVTPEPVTNERFAKTLGRVLRRPARFTIPERLIKGVYGRMGREILLASTRVFPEKLIDAGFTFRYPELESALRHLLGK